MNEVEIHVRVNDDTRRGAARVSSSMRSLFRRLGGDADEGGGQVGEKLSRGILGALQTTMTAGLKPIAGLAAGGFAAQFAGAASAALASGGAKVARGFGAGLALLPAAAAAAGMALGALRVGLLGVGDALSAGLAGDTEKFDEALKGLSPSARNVARDVAGLKGRLDELKGAVQESLFAPLVDSVRPLADAYLPAVQSNLSAIARTFGQVGNQTAAFFTMPATTEAVNKALANMREAVVNVVSGLGSLVMAFVPLVTVGSTFLPQLTSGFGGLTARVASFMSEAERTGELAAFIQRGLDSLKSLMVTAAQVGRIFSNIGAIGSRVWGALGLQTGGLLDSIERLTGRAREFAESARGSEAMGRVFEVLRTVVGGFLDTLGRALGILGDAFGPIMPDLLAFVEAFARLKQAVLDVALDALEPVIHGLADALGFVLPLITGLFDLLARNQPVLQGIGIAILTLLVPALTAWAVSAAQAAAFTLASIAPLLLVGAAIAAVAALIIIHWDTIKAVGVAVWHVIYAAAAAVAGAIGAVVQGLWYVIQGVWNGITAAGVAVWHAIYAAAAWVRDRIVDAATWVRDVVTGAFDWVRDRVVGVWDAIWDKVAWVRDSIGDAVDWVKDKLAGIAEAISDLPGAGVVRGLVSAIPGFAHGGIVGAAAGGVRSGLQMVGEHGAELVKLPAGSRVHGNADTNRMLAGAGGGGAKVENHFHIAGSILAERDLVKIVGEAIRLGNLRDPLAVAGVRPA